MANTTFHQTNQQTSLTSRARRYATIVDALFVRIGLTGSLKSARRGARHLSLAVRLADPTGLDKALKLAEPLALHANVEAVLAQRLVGVVLYQFQLSQGYWEYYTRADLPQPQAIGLAEQRQPVTFQLDPPHTLVAGTTGSGKTETIKSILLSLMSSYKPDELGILLTDPNRILQNFKNAAHLIPVNGCTIASSSEEIRAAIAYAKQLVKHRIENDIKGDKPIVLIMDEATPEDVLGSKKFGFNNENLADVAEIATRARVYGIHLIIGTQEPSEADLPGIFGKLNNRFVGLVANAYLSARLTGQAGLTAHKLTGKGDFIHVSPEEVQRFQVAAATRADFDRLERCETAPVKVDVSDIITLPPPEPEPKPAGGRPPVQVDPRIAAGYFWKNPDSISIAMAQYLFNLSRTGHSVHKQFVNEFIAELRRLRAAGQLGAGL